MHLKALSREVESVGLLPRRYSSRVVLVYSPRGIPRGWSWFTPPEVFLAGGLGLLPRRYSSRVVLVFSSGRDLISVTLAFIQDEILSRSPWSSHQGEILSRSPWPSPKTRSYLGRLGLLQTFDHCMGIKWGVEISSFTR